MFIDIGEGGLYLAMMREGEGWEEGLLRNQLRQNQVHRGGKEMMVRRAFHGDESCEVDRKMN